MTTRELIKSIVDQLVADGFVLDEEEKSYLLIDYRGTHKITTYWVDGLWVTFTETIEADDGPNIPFDELLKEYGNDAPAL